MATHEPIRKRTNGPGPVREIPDKLYFRIGEVAKLCEVPAYVLRFWEGEFPQLKPNKGGTGQRLYRRRDVEMALRIKTLLYDEGYTIPGARQAFKTELRSSKDTTAPGAESGSTDSVATTHLAALQEELRAIHALLSKPPVTRSAVQPIRMMQVEPMPMPAPMAEVTPFRKPTLVGSAKTRKQEAVADSFINSLFDDLPPLA